MKKDCHGRFHRLEEIKEERRSILKEGNMTNFLMLEMYPFEGSEGKYFSNEERLSWKISSFGRDKRRELIHSKGRKYDKLSDVGDVQKESISPKKKNCHGRFNRLEEIKEETRSFLKEGNVQMESISPMKKDCHGIFHRLEEIKEERRSILNEGNMTNFLMLEMFPFEGSEGKYFSKEERLSWKISSLGSDKRGEKIHSKGRKYDKLSDVGDVQKESISLMKKDCHGRFNRLEEIKEQRRSILKKGNMTNFLMLTHLAHNLRSEGKYFSNEERLSWKISSFGRDKISEKINFKGRKYDKLSDVGDVQKESISPMKKYCHGSFQRLEELKEERRSIRKEGNMTIFLMMEMYPFEGSEEKYFSNEERLSWKISSLGRGNRREKIHSKGRKYDNFPDVGDVLFRRCNSSEGKYFSNEERMSWKISSFGRDKRREKIHSKGRKYDKLSDVGDVRKESISPMKKDCHGSFHRLEELIEERRSIQKEGNMTNFLMLEMYPFEGSEEKYFSNEERLSWKISSLG
ncbi:uncharacterized protein [Parasteatoda tepidariorum]|uniref:uncharacterized protein n=1 Tax=Parasteatoda tepidariorum TaxID=114398 RepID=UPI0039BC3DC3